MLNWCLPRTSAQYEIVSTGKLPITRVGLEDDALQDTGTNPSGLESGKTPGSIHADTGPSATGEITLKTLRRVVLPALPPSPRRWVHAPR